MGTESQGLRSEGATGALPHGADSSCFTVPATDSVPACRSAPSIAQPSVHTTLLKEACTACGREGEFLHRLKQEGAVRDFCSSCILSFHKGMYCCLCLVVYANSAELGDPGLWLTCAKCQRMSHLECARDSDLYTASVFFTCHICSQAEKAPIKDASVSTGALIENGSPPVKKLRLSSDEQEQALAAAHIVAFLAVQQAKDAKARARASAAVAAKAAARAKAALDTAYRVAQEEARWKPESSKRFPGVLPGKNRGTMPSLSMLNAPVNGRAEGRVPMPNVPHLQVGKDHNTVGYGPLNTKFTGQYHKMKALLPNAEAISSVPSCQDLLPRSGVFQKPATMCLKAAVAHSANGGPYMESEGAPVSASPASILDAASSLDAPRLSTPTETGAAQVGMPEATANSTGGSSQVTLLEAQLATFDNKERGAEDASISAPCPGKGILVNSKSSIAPSCVIDVEDKEDNPHVTGADTVAVDDLVDVRELLSEGCAEERQVHNLE